MKVIHTSDWHLGDKLYFWDRADEEAHFFNLLRKAVEEEQPDALLVSGDVFDTGTPGNDVAKSFTDRLLEVTSAAPEMATIIIAGNHDSYSRLVVDKELWKCCNVHMVGVPAEDAEGFADFSGNIITLPGKGIIAAVPFCHPRNFPMVRGDDTVGRQEAYFAGLRDACMSVREEVGVPFVLMAHLAVGRDTDFTGQDRSGVIGGEECIDIATLGGGYDYIALGHIHHPQWIGGSDKTARYCGTPRAIHFDEMCDHGVDVVEIAFGEKPVRTFKKFEPLRKLVTVGGAKGLPFEEAIKAFEDLQNFERESYVRFNVALACDALPGADWTDRARAAVDARGGRFCLVNPIRMESEKEQSVEMASLSMKELRELSNDEIARVLSVQHAITETQSNLLREVIDEVCNGEIGE